MMYSFDEDPPALEDVFRNELWDLVSIFTDDIIIYSDTFEEHLEHIQTVFKRLRDARLKTKRKKCHFCVPVLNFLGHEVSAEGIKPKVDNVRKLLDAKKPKTTKEVQSFLGLTDYYRCFVPGYSKIAKPLYKCIPKFQWGEEQDKAWQTLIEKLINPPLLEFPDFNKEFILNTDASGLAFGYVLSQTWGDYKPHPIRYGGRVLRNAEIRYTISEKELLSLVYAVRDCSQYLEGRFFTIFTDHQPLTHALRFRDSSGSLSRWAVLLQQYSFEIRYKRGAKNSDADAMSRAPIQSVSEAFVGSVRLVPTTEIAAEQECDRP
uniref:Reverse transcriptase domain-containing protein n=1 Tax=Clytia hemisphaerica TaxID=252671 RepID=A0A7M5WY55_9CNID